MPCSDGSPSNAEVINDLERTISKYRNALGLDEIYQRIQQLMQMNECYKISADNATRMLCGLMQSLEDSFGTFQNKVLNVTKDGTIIIVDELDRWWSDHKDWDEKRKEKEKQDAIALKQVEELHKQQKIAELETQLEKLKNE